VRINKCIEYKNGVFRSCIRNSILNNMIFACCSWTDRFKWENKSSYWAIFKI